MKNTCSAFALSALLALVIFACHNSGGMFVDDPLADPGPRTDDSVVVCVPANDGSGASWTTTVDASEVDEWLAQGATMGACAIDEGDDVGMGDDDDDDDLP